MRNAIRGMLGLILMSLRGLRQRKVRTILTIIAITVGVAAVVSVSIVQETAQGSISDAFGGAAGDADLIVTNATASIGDTEGFDAGTLDQVLDVPGVELAAPLLQLTTSSSRELEDWESNIYISILNGTLLYGIDPVSSSAIGHYQLLTGEDITSDSGNKVLVSESYADSLGIGIGDTLQLAIPGGMADFQVVGLIDINGLARLNQGKVVLAGLETVAAVTDRPDTLDQIDVIAESRVGQQKLKENLESTLGPMYNIALPEDKGEQTDATAELATTALAFVALLVIAIGLFLIYNTFATTMAERSREMGLMRAIGAGRSHIIGIVLGEACLLGMISSLLGIPLGIGLAQGLGSILEESTGTLMQSPVILPEHLILAFIMGTGIAIIASLIPAIQSGRLSPVEALTENREISRARSDKQFALGVVLLVFSLGIFIYHIFAAQDISFNKAFAILSISVIGIVLILPLIIPLFERMLSRMTRITGIYGEIGGRNMGRRPGRTALTVGVLVLGIAGIILAEGAKESYKTYSQDYFDKIIQSDLLIHSPQPLPREVIDDIDDMPGVSEATGIGLIPAKMVDSKGLNEIDGIFVASDLSQHDGNAWEMPLLDYKGSQSEAMAMVESGGALIIESYTAEHFGLGTGDSITLETLDGKKTFEIAGVIFGRQFTGFAVVGSWEQALDYYGTDKSTYAKVNVNPDYDIASVESAILDRWGEAYHLETETYADWCDRVWLKMDEVLQMTELLQLVGIAIAALAIINTLMMNVWERRRELGMLRAVGMTRRQLIGIVTAEALGLGILGGAIGIGLGVLALPAVTDAYSSLVELGVDLPTMLTVQAITISIVIAVVIPVVASLLPAWQGTRIDIVEAMRTE